MEIIFWGGAELYEMMLSYYKKYNIILSKTFITCANYQLGLFFLKITGLKSLNKCGIGLEIRNKIIDDTSSFEMTLGVNYQSQFVKICWKSKSGKIYQMHDEVDCNDIEFWLEGVDVPLVYKQLYGPTALPFKIPTTHYQLVVGSISISLQIRILLKKEHSNALGLVEKELSSFIADFNAKSEKKDRRDGIIHNWNITGNDLEITTQLDLGSAGAVFLKKLLKWLNEFEQVEKVVMGNTPD